jgi:hypothetical protein
LLSVITRQKSARPADQPKDKNNGGDFSCDVGSLHTFTGSGDMHDKKVLNRAVAVYAVTRVDVMLYLDWSEQSIGWSRADQATPIVNPGSCALVVRPKVADYQLPKTLMDGGSSINILYLNTFRCLQLPESMIEPTRCTFHGIVPGRMAFPISKVTLPVAFGTPQNYHSERIIFDLVNFHSCVLGRQAFAKFMTVSHYAYNLLKIPGPNGVITVHDDFDLAQECEDNDAKLADAIIAEETHNTSELTAN